MKARKTLVVWKASNALVKKIEVAMGSKKHIPLDFAKYLSFSEAQKNIRVVNV